MKKKNLTRFLAFALVLIQVFTLAFCFTVTTSAEETDATPTADYIFYPTSETMTLDGNANEKIWSNVPAVSFVNGNATLKGTYTKIDEAVTVYFLIEVVDKDGDYIYMDQNWTRDGFVFVMDEKTPEGLNNDGVNYANIVFRRGRFLTSTIGVSDAATGTAITVPGLSNYDNGAYLKYAVQDNRGSGEGQGTYTIELSYELFVDTTTDICFNMMLQHNPVPDTSTHGGWIQNTFKSTTTAYKTPAGVATGYLATVEPNMLAGAGMRLATDTNDSGLRFETQINKANYDALITAGATVTTGTLILPTTQIPTGTLTKQALLDAGAVDVKNTGWANADTAETDGYYTFFGSIVKIKEANISKAFSGISYVTVTQDGNSVTYLSNYNEADHSRDVKTVAQAALDSGKYSAYETILDAYLQ